MTAQVQMVNGTYWHTTFSMMGVVELAQHGPWLVLPLVGDPSHAEPLSVVVAREHIASIRALADLDGVKSASTSRSGPPTDTPNREAQSAKTADVRERGQR